MLVDTCWNVHLWRVNFPGQFYQATLECWILWIEEMYEHYDFKNIWSARIFLQSKTGFEFCAQTSEEWHKWGPNTGSNIDFRVFLSMKCFSLVWIAFPLFNFVATSEICCSQLRFSSVFTTTYFTESVG